MLFTSDAAFAMTLRRAIDSRHGCHAADYFAMPPLLLYLMPPLLAYYATTPLRLLLDVSLMLPR